MGCQPMHRCAWSGALGRMARPFPICFTPQTSGATVPASVSRGPQQSQVLLFQWESPGRRQIYEDCAVYSSCFLSPRVVPFGSRSIARTLAPNRRDEALAVLDGKWWLGLCILLGATCRQCRPCRQASKPSLGLLLVHKELAGNAPFSAGFVPWQQQAKNTDGIAATHKMVLVTSCNARLSLVACML